MRWVLYPKIEPSPKSKKQRNATKRYTEHSWQNITFQSGLKVLKSKKKQLSFYDESKVHSIRGNQKRKRRSVTPFYSKVSEGNFKFGNAHSSWGEQGFVEK